MRIFIAILLLCGLQACNTDKIEPNDLVGKWIPNYETRTKDANGDYGEWVTINTLVALPVVSFTADGRLQYLQEEEAIEGCCQYQRYSLSGNNIKLSDLFPCPTVRCAFICSDWKILRLDKNVLELEICGNVQNRYYRQGYN
jgi:hypothetical protein